MNIFLIGINGIGMQGLAIVAQQQGYNVYGFDDAGELELLKSAGIEYSNEIPANIDCVVYSSGIQSSHPLMAYAKTHQIPCYNRTDFWINNIKLNNELILVAGAHGKTTATSLAAYICGMKSYAIGGIVQGYKYAASHEKDRFSVLETDESDGSFIKWHGKYKILLNYNAEHLEYYDSEEKLIEYYKEFANQNENNLLIIESECKKFLNIPNTSNVITYGKAGSNSDFIYSNIEFKNEGIQFTINGKPIFLPLFGEHNASNLTAIYATLTHAGMSHEEITAKASIFPGAQKRMHKIKEQNGFTLWLDYGHHPAEIKATLAGLWQNKKIKPNVIHEPHKYTRINQTLEQWPDIFKGYKVFVTDLHSAGEEIIEQATTENFIKYLLDNKIDVTYLKNIADYKLTNDTIVFSAGKLSSQLVK